MSYGMGQNFNPHALHVGIIKDFESKWYPENQSINDYLVVDSEIGDDLKSKRFLERIGQYCSIAEDVVKMESDFNSQYQFYISNELSRYSLFNRRIILRKLLGKRGYKKVVNKVKTLSR